MLQINIFEHMKIRDDLQTKCANCINAEAPAQCNRCAFCTMTFPLWDKMLFDKGTGDNMSISDDIIQDDQIIRHYPCG